MWAPIVCNGRKPGLMNPIAYCLKFRKALEEKSLGWNITNILLKDISQNFLGDDEETQHILQKLFQAEDKFVKEQGKFDAVFGIYRPKNQ